MPDTDSDRPPLPVLPVDHVARFSLIIPAVAFVDLFLFFAYISPFRRKQQRGFEVVGERALSSIGNCSITRKDTLTR